MSLALPKMPSRVSGRDLTVGRTCWRLDFLTGTTESIRVVSLGEDAVFCEGDEMAISFWMRILIVSLVNAFFFAHWLMCVRFCLAVFLLVQPSPQPMHLDSWVSCESGKWSGGSFVGGAAGRDGPGSGVREAEWVVS